MRRLLRASVSLSLSAFIALAACSSDPPPGTAAFLLDSGTGSSDSGKLTSNDSGAGGSNDSGPGPGNDAGQDAGQDAGEDAGQKTLTALGIPLPGNPAPNGALAVNETTLTAYIALEPGFGSTVNGVAVVDLTTHAVTTVNVPSYVAGAIAVDPVQNLVFLSGFNGGPGSAAAPAGEAITIIDGTTNTIIGTISSSVTFLTDLVIDPVTHTLYGTSTGGTVGVYDITTKTQTTTVNLTGFTGDHAFEAIDPASKKLWVLGKTTAGGQLAEVSTQTNTAGTVTPIAGTPVSLASSADLSSAIAVLQTPEFVQELTAKLSVPAGFTPIYIEQPSAKCPDGLNVLFARDASGALYTLTAGKNDTAFSNPVKLDGVPLADHITGAKRAAFGGTMFVTRKDAGGGSTEPEQVFYLVSGDSCGDVPDGG